MHDITTIPMEIQPFLTNRCRGENKRTKRRVEALTDTDDPFLTCFITGLLPRGFGLIRTVELLYIPTTTGTWDYTVDTQAAAIGEDKDIHTDSKTADGVTATDDLIHALDITSAFDLYLPGDAFGCRVTCDVLTTTTKINVIGIRIQEMLRRE